MLGDTHERGMQPTASLLVFCNMNKASEPTQLNTTACQTDESIPVVVVGAGPTGLAAGNLLGEAGLATLIIERNIGLSNIPKAIALDDEGLRIFQAMNLRTATTNYLLSHISIPFF